MHVLTKSSRMHIFYINMCLPQCLFQKKAYASYTNLVPTFTICDPKCGKEYGTAIPVSPVWHLQFNEQLRLNRPPRPASSAAA